MADFIEREALENELNRRLKFLIAEYGEHDQYTSGFDDAMDKVENFPAADVAPVVHGRWIHNPDYERWAEMYMCSICNRNALTDGDYRHKLSDYCPHCGAKMDGEEQDND